jgi:hypothetical protein
MAGDGAHDLVNECNFLQAGAVRSGCLYDMGGCHGFRNGLILERLPGF